jgi:acyl-CoA thioester hydrolase
MAESSPAAFELLIEVKPTDIDQLGHVNNVVYVRWVQDIAVAHWRAAASADQQDRLLWVVLRHEIDYKSPAVLGDSLAVKTWVGNASALKFERHTEFVRASDGRAIAQARTIWCPIDVKSRRPVAVGADVRESFSVR